MGSLFNQFMDFLCGLNEQEWFLILVGGVILGFLCLRGFGSRSKY